MAPGDFYQDKPIRFNPNLPVQRTDTLLGSRLVSTSYMNFAPRLGIAWSPSQKWTVRLGAGFSMPRISVMLFSTWAGTPCGIIAPLVCIDQPLALVHNHDHKTPYVEQYEFNPAGEWFDGSLGLYLFEVHR